MLLLNAGHEASVNGAGNGWWTLFRHPEALAALRDTPDLAATAIDELLRFDTPLPMFERWVLSRHRGRRHRPSLAARRWRCCTRPRTAIPAAFVDAGLARPRPRRRRPTSRSARGSTTAWARRSRAWSCRHRSRSILRRMPGLELLEEPRLEAHVHPARPGGVAGSVLTRGSFGAVVAVGLFVAGCAVSGERPTPTVLRYVALGDSYTIGTSVRAGRALAGPAGRGARTGRARPSSSSANLGVNGYTSADVIRDELPALEDLGPSSSTVLIGVNDVVQGVPIRDVRGQRRDDPRRAPRPAFPPIAS